MVDSTVLINLGDPCKRAFRPPAEPTPRRCQSSQWLQIFCPVQPPNRRIIRWVPATLQAAIAQSVYRFATGCMVGDRIPVGTIFSTPVQKGHGPHQASLRIGTGSFPGVKCLGCGVDNPPQFITGGKERVDIHLPHLWVFLACSSVRFAFSFTQDCSPTTTSSSRSYLHLVQKL